MVRRLAKGFHFTINDGEITTQPRKNQKSNKKTMYLYRIIISYALYNCVDGLESTMDIHHVDERFLNTVNCLRYELEDAQKEIERLEKAESELKKASNK